MMTNEERNTALYQKMFAEQENFRDLLKSQPPEEILNHAYEYTIREDILLSLLDTDFPYTLHTSHTILSFYLTKS